jgi:hypothetical protein
LGYPIDPSLKLGLDSHNGIKGARVAIEAIDPGYRQPYGHNWFLGLQRQLLGRTVLEVSWIGSAGHHLVNISNVNRFDGDMLNGGVFHGFNPSFSSINMARTTSNSIYHAGTLAMRRQVSRTPSRARRIAMARPIPLLAPVTRAVLFFRGISIKFAFRG